jgi:hypothetical protein
MLRHTTFLKQPFVNSFIWIIKALNCLYNKEAKYVYIVLDF